MKAKNPPQNLQAFSRVFNRIYSSSLVESEDEHHVVKSSRNSWKVHNIFSFEGSQD